MGRRGNRRRDNGYRGPVMIEGKLHHARQLIADEMARARSPLALWSSGKDSMLMLALVREVAPDVPVAYLRGFEHPTKHQFADAMAAKWNLRLVDLPLVGRDVVAKGGHVELIEAYEIAPNVRLYFPLEAEPGYVPGPDSLCAIEKLNDSPRLPVSPSPRRHYDCIFVGHRGDDVDPAHGAVPLADYVAESNSVRTVYPLKDFTERDVWLASALLGVPQSFRRYREKDMRFNADYWPLCVRCLEPAEGATVICPKFNEEIYALNALINPEARREEWARQFINIERSHEKAA
jgi:hypothetical protein